jgi:tetratricopeptide (TPR) repeat protein
MEISKIILQHKQISNRVAAKKIKQSLDVLSDMISNTSTGEMRDELTDIELTYRNMLTYTIDGIKDPERNKVYLKLIQSILRLSDRAKQDILSHYSGWHTYWVKQQMEKEMRLTGKTIVESVDDLIFKSDLDEWLKLGNEMNPDPDSDLSRNHKKLIRSIFNHLWLTDYYGEAEETLIDIIAKHDKFRWYETSIFVTAITLSLFRTFQTEKFFRLIEIYESGEKQVMERAVAGLVMNLHYYNGRIMLYPEITAKIEMLSSDKKFSEHVRIIVFQLIRSRETENLSRKLQDEILPQVAKLKPKIEEKLDLDNILPKDINEGKNPDWSDMISESDEIFRTMEELTKLQMEGADVYMSAFANMKHFDFFKDFQNWFVPFYPDHETVDEIYRDEILGPGTNELAEALYKTPFICNSDKYSLLLNLKNLPSAQKSMMLKVFRMELEGLQQLNEDENLTDPTKVFRTTITQYLQDIYRFFKLSQYRKEFEDIFSGKLDIYNSAFFSLTGNGPEAEGALADYFFSKNFYNDALQLFLKQIEDHPDESQLYEKIGYCYQENDNFEYALKYYRLAELIDRKIWTIKKIGFCLRRLGRYEDSLEYYIQASDMEPENLHSVIMIAHCLLDLKRYEEALKYYFRVEYQDPGNLKVLRPVAYCYFVLGKYKESEKYYDRLSAGKLNSHDLINKGHLALCRGKQKDAVELYRQSLATGEITREKFLAIFAEDQPILESLGVNGDDIPIILDYLLYIAG